HQTAMAPYTVYLEAQLEHFDSNHPLPQLHKSENKSTFEQAFFLAKKELSSKVVLMKQQETTLLGTLQHINKKKQILVDDLLKKTQQGREKQIDDVTLQTHSLYQQMQDSAPKVITHSYELKRFLQEEYEPALKELHKRYAQEIKDLKGKLVTVYTQLETKKEELLNYTHQNSDRVLFLNSAHEELIKFKQSLEARLGIYIPATQVPKDALKNYLECDEVIGSFLETIYATEQTSTSWKGFNRTNVYNKLLHYSSILKTSAFDGDIKQIAQYIDNKISLINKELKVDSTTRDFDEKNILNEKPNTSSLSEKTHLLGQINLWTLHNQYKKNELEVPKTEPEKINPQHAEFLALLKQQTKMRIDFLDSARNHLIQFQEALEENQRLYIHGQQIPQDVLKKFLECDSRMAAVIEEVYSQEQSANSWLNWFSAAPIDYDYDITTVLDYIREKIDLIDAEKQVDLISGEVKTVSLTDESTSPPSSLQLLSEKNLWFFHSELMRLQEEITVIEKRIESNEHELIALKNKKTTELNVWEFSKTDKEQALAQASLAHQLNTLAHRQSLINLNSYQLEFKLNDFDGKQNYLDGVVLSLETMEPTLALVFLEQLQQSIAATNVEKLMAQSIVETSGTALQKRIEEDVNLQIKGLEEAKQLYQIVTNKSEPLIILMQDVEENISTLNNKKTYLSDLFLKLNQTHTVKIKEVNTNKDLLIIINKLIDANKKIQSHYPNLMFTDMDIPKSKNERKKMIVERKQFIANYFEPLREFTNNPHKRVKNYFNPILSKINLLKDEVVLLNLENVYEDSKELLKRFSLHNRNGRKGLYEDIERFLANSSPILKKQKHSNNKSIKKKTQAITENIDQMDVIKNILAPSTPGSMNLFPDGDEPIDDIIEPSISQNDMNISEYYFGTGSNDGVFSTYLSERAKTFWFKDFCRSLAVLTLGCFGYKTDAIERTEYILELKETYQQFKDDENQGNELLHLIEQGQKRFTPRAAAGKAGYDKSLYSILESFKSDLKLKPAVVDYGYEPQTFQSKNS
ncbi:MAG: hypothetical protein PSV35_09780, partial [bacterium]|nr:hypothetical protein [bacterium]